VSIRATGLVPIEFTTQAAISGTDAATIALAGVLSTNPDHRRSADLLLEVAGSAPYCRRRARQLRTLLARKTPVDYERNPFWLMPCEK
jgi:hypothetical protein